MENAEPLPPKKWGSYYSGDPYALYGPFRPPPIMVRRPFPKACVYVMRAGSLLKIGRTRNVGRRLLEFRLSNPDIKLGRGFTVPATLAPQIERLAHLRLAHFSRSREWFAVSPQVAYREIREIVRDAEYAFAIMVMRRDIPIG